MNRLDGPLEIVTFANFVDRMGWAAWPRNRIEDRKRYSHYRHLKPDLSMSYELYYDVEGAREAFRRRDDGRSDEEIVYDYGKRIGLDVGTIPTGKELDERVDTDLAGDGYRTLRVLRWNGREAVLRHFLDSILFPDERTRAAGIKQLLDGPVIVGVATGRGERSVRLGGPTDYHVRFQRLSERFSLLNHGFRYVDLDLSKPMPSEIDILMIADPQQSYSVHEIGTVRDYLARGGDMVMLLEASSSDAVDQILRDLDLSRGKPVRQVDDTRFPADFLLAEASPGVLDAYWGSEVLSAPVILDGAVSIHAEDGSAGYSIMPILTVGDSVMAYALERNTGAENQRIVVFGDADVFSTANAERRIPVNNSMVAFDVFHWLTEGAYPVQRTRPDPIDTSVRVGREVVTALNWFLIGILPLSFLLTGGALLTLRRRR